MNDSKKIFKVHVTPHAKQNKVIQDNDVLRVYTTTAPEKGHANGAVIKLLSDYFNVAKSRIVISKGLASRNKIVVIQ
ncbi:MAG: DUF167 domain-containing protein [Alphaproteobacteria bacterium]|nr:DUF167 domain-containing protein [Alphaproteobacteria bacterium]